MLPKPPQRVGQLGFLFFPPIRIIGTSIAGEGTAIVIPEYDLCFDIGTCFKPMLGAKYVALTHGHMDHVAMLPYYFSQRRFQGMGVGTCICDTRIAPAVRNMMQGWIDLERQQTEHIILDFNAEEEIQIKNNLFLKMFEVDHRVPAVGYSVIERRTKLKEEYTNLPQSKLVGLKKQGKEITNELRIPIVTYLGDTLPGPHFYRDEVLNTKILITECTFFEPQHKDRALLGKHVHIQDIKEFLPKFTGEAIVLTHISRRTNLHRAKEETDKLFSNEEREKIFFLMDHRANRERYENQLTQAETSAQNQPQPT